jgi:CRISPR/Cas system-associated exonuclease Cas4 (RecB family)
MAKGLGKFFAELMRWAKTGDGEVSIEGGGEGDVNPLEGYRQAFVRPWPGPARPDDTDAVFSNGWRHAAAAAADAGSVPPSLLAALDDDERGAFDRVASGRRTLAAHLIERERAVSPPPPRPSSVAVGSLVDFARCPKLFYWKVVRPLPSFAGPSARIGSEIHRWIEMKSRGQATLIELEDEPDVTVEELAGTPGRLEDLREAFRRSRFGDMVPLYAERPFLLHVEGVTVKGRIDAIYGTPEGRWEVVDYKTGRVPDDDDPLVRTQLDVYALACVDVWHKRADDLRLTYLYLSSDTERSYEVGDVEAVRSRVGGWLRSIREEAFEPTPGEHCRWCDFLPFCDAGRAWAEANGVEVPR